MPENLYKNFELFCTDLYQKPKEIAQQTYLPRVKSSRVVEHG